MGALGDRMVGQSSVQNAIQPLEFSADLGMVLMDLSFQMIGYDRGAAAILTGSGQSGSGFTLPRELQQVIQTVSPAELPTVRMQFHKGGGQYKCQTYLVRSQCSSLPRKILVVHLERECTAEDAVAKLTTQYHLTVREQQALSGLAMGLATKELAERMKISPNTVKSFLRLIMIKVGVTTRGELVAKLLGYSNHGNE